MTIYHRQMVRRIGLKIYLFTILGMKRVMTSQVKGISYYHQMRDILKFRIDDEIYTVSPYSDFDLEIHFDAYFSSMMRTPFLWFTAHI